VSVAVVPLQVSDFEAAKGTQLGRFPLFPLFPLLGTPRYLLSDRRLSYWLFTSPRDAPQRRLLAGICRLSTGRFMPNADMSCLVAEDCLEDAPAGAD
jgi:hypothetical protein